MVQPQGMKTTKVILLTNDRENVEKAKALNLSVHTVYKYAKSPSSCQQVGQVLGEREMVS